MVLVVSQPQSYLCSSDICCKCGNWPLHIRAHNKRQCQTSFWFLLFFCACFVSFFLSFMTVTYSSSLRLCFIYQLKVILWGICNNAVYSKFSHLSHAAYCPAPINITHAVKKNAKEKLTAPCKPVFYKEGTMVFHRCNTLVEID